MQQQQWQRHRRDGAARPARRPCMPPPAGRALAHVGHATPSAPAWVSSEGCCTVHLPVPAGAVMFNMAQACGGTRQFLALRRWRAAPPATLAKPGPKRGTPAVPATPSTPIACRRLFVASSAALAPIVHRNAAAPASAGGLRHHRGPGGRGEHLQQPRGVRRGQRRGAELHTRRSDRARLLQARQQGLHGRHG